ncbi:MAG: sensor histidine kinase [Spirochaetaceae bacterium]|nr:sensor histidine kinase [Spirochaetaceae bacterium]
MPRLASRRYFHRVLGLFLAASLLPVLVLSFALTGIAASVLERESDERGRAAAEAFASRFDAIAEGVSRSLALVAAAPETFAALVPRRSPAGEEAAALGRFLAREAAREGGLAFAFAPAGGGRAYATRALPRDFDPAVYGDWGVFRKARASRGTVFLARRRIAEDGEAALVVAGRAIRDEGGEILAYALAELDRGALVRAARSGGLDADFELVAPSGLVAFSLADSSREGRFEDELPPASRRRPAGGVYAAAAAAGFSARARLPASLLGELTAAMRSATYAGLAACAALALVLALAASRIVTEPVLALSGAMRRLREGDLAARLEPRSDDELGDLVRSFNATADELGRLMRETVEDQELLRGAELRSLAARMNPHFLYNSLNSIRSLAKLGRDGEIVEIVTRLGKLLRASAGNREELSTVGEGLELVRHYLAVEKIRFGERFRFEESVDPALLSCELPSLALEPLAENALTHGLERKAGPGLLRIEGRVAEGDAVISFEDAGPGVPPELLAELASRLEAGEVPEGGRGLGLAATNRRLRLRYGADYGLAVGAGSGGRGFRVELRVPARGAAPGESP